MKRVHRRLQLKVRPVVDDLHRHFAKWSCENYNSILLPKFQTPIMIRRGLQRIGSKTARATCTWSHYRFQQHLLHKARQYPHGQVLLVKEPYTPISCGRCGHVTRIGAAETFRCRQSGCNFSTDLDFNGARNILLRYLSLYCQS
jgi:transposase